MKVIPADGYHICQERKFGIISVCSAAVEFTCNLDFVVDTGSTSEEKAPPDCCQSNSSDNELNSDAKS